MEWVFKDGFWQSGNWRISADGGVEHCFPSASWPGTKWTEMFVIESGVDDAKKLIEELNWTHDIVKTPSVEEARKRIEE
jgi:hypothetical protein